MSEEAAATGDNSTGQQIHTGGPQVTEQKVTSWADGLDEDTSVYVQNKGWKDPKDILTSYRNLEKFAGGSKNLVELPSVDADPDSLNHFYNKLGRPETPDSYKLGQHENADPEITEWYKNTAHELGLTDKQASTLYDKWNKMSADQMEKMQQESLQNAEQELAGLKKEWGKGYEAQVDAGRRAVNALGYNKEQLDALEQKMGTAEMMKLFANVGSKMGEDAFADGSRSGSSGAFGLTPAAARQQLSELKMDKNFMAEYLNGNKDAIAKMERIMGAAYA